MYTHLGPWPMLWTLETRWFCFIYRPISITHVLSRVMERFNVQDHIYPSMRCPQLVLIFEDQFVFLPTGSTTAALIKLIHEVTAMLESNLYVIVYSINISKTFDTVQHSELLGKYAKMKLSDLVYKWLVDFFRAHTSKITVHHNLGQHHLRFGSSDSLLRRHKLWSSPTHTWPFDGTVCWRHLSGYLSGIVSCV